MKKFEDLREEVPANAMAGGQIAGSREAGDDPPVRKKKKKVIRRKFAECEVFVVSSDVYFEQTKRPKTSNERYVKLVGSDETGLAIREYAKNNPGKGIIIEDEFTGHMTWLRLPKGSRIKF